MSAASASSSKMDLALALFAPGGKRAGSAGGGSSTDAQAQQKRDCAAREHRLARAPQHVKGKLAAICALKGRDRGKNAAKSKFTEMILKDAKFEDAYWQQEVSDAYTVSDRKQEHWQLRAKVETQMGGGQKGKDEVQAAIDAGIYKSRVYKAKNKDGKIIHVEEVAVCEQIDSATRDQCYKEKARAGGASNEQEFRSKLVDAFGEPENDAASSKPVLKRPAGKDMVQVVKTESTATSKKRAAIADGSEGGGAGNRLKRPAGAEGGLTQESLANLDAEAEGQNQQLNACVVHGVKMLAQKKAVLLETDHVLGQLTFSAVEAKLVQGILAEIKTLIESIERLHGQMQLMAIKNKDSQHTTLKIDVLNEAGESINMADSLVSAAKPFLKKPKSGASAAGSCA